MRRFIHRHEVSEQRAHGLRLRRELYGDVESDPEATFGSNECSPEIVSITLAELAAKLDDLAAGQKDSHRQDVIERDTVLEAVGTTRILSDVPTNRASRFARWIRSVEQSMCRDVLVESEVHDPGLNGGATVLDIERDDLLETVESDDDDVICERASR